MNKAKYIGETRKMNCGVNATIIKFQNKGDITVEFEDKVIKEHRRYNDFKNGTISNKNRNIIGYKIHDFEVIGKTDIYDAKWHTLLYECKCKCGQTILFPRAKILEHMGHMPYSCGCNNQWHPYNNETPIDEIGLFINSLEIKNSDKTRIYNRLRRSGVRKIKDILDLKGQVRGLSDSSWGFLKIQAGEYLKNENH